MDLANTPAEPVAAALAAGPGTAEATPAQVAQVLRQFRMVVNAIKSHQQLTERLAGLTGAQVWALHLIDSQPGLGIKGLAQAMDVRQPTASILAKALVQQGLVQALRLADDRRSTQLQVTAAGRSLLDRAPGPFAGVLPEALGRLDRSALAQLAQGLAQLIQVLPADPRSGHVPLSPLSPPSPG
ncbi:MAG: MarR family transcriptional regulator [Pseudomonadota bacterium]